MFPECNNKVDIVADAEVIKKIFKIPYNEESVSIMVRKIGNVLLIDNYEPKKVSNTLQDIIKNSLNENKKYFDELKKIHSDPPKTNNNLIKILRSKFLYRCAIADPEASNRLTSANSKQAARMMQKFSRIIYWTFEKTKMIIGTNVAKTKLFENETSRNVTFCVAREGQHLKIINAIDIWLDNLMCDIPEIVICFHSDGVVKHYECIKTQDIPYLPGSPFSTTKIQNTVQKLFSFLLNQEYLPGQAYSLVKCKGDNIFKFFDLNMSESEFAYEGGKLSYRFGHNQYYSFNKRKESSNTVLLNASITTLNGKIHPEIVASANYLNVDLTFSYEIFKTSLFTLSKVEFEKCKGGFESIKNRCLDALANINDGLKCLQNFSVSEKPQEMTLKKYIKTNSFLEGNFNFKNDKNYVKNEFFYINVSSLFPNAEHRSLVVLPTWEDVNEDRAYWKNYLKFLFYQKAELIYGILAQQYFYYDMFELCLRSLDMMVRFNKVKTEIDPSSHAIPFNLVLVMVGDCCKLASNTIDLSKNSDCSNVAEIENILTIDEKYYKIKPCHYALQLKLMDYSQIELLDFATRFYIEPWIRMWNGKRTMEIDETMNFILKKVYASNLKLGLIYYDMLHKSREKSSYMDYFEQSKKYLKVAYETASSPLEKASAVFHCSKLHVLLFTISLHKVLPSCEENNLSEYYRIFLDSAKNTLQILYDENNADNGPQWHKYFNKSFSSIDVILRTFTKNGENTIVAKLRHTIIEGSASVLQEILKICELQKQRNNNAEFDFACGRTSWCIATNLFKRMKLGSRSNVTIIRDHFLKAIEYFSQENLWWFHITALVNYCDFTLYQSQDEFDLPLKMKMENIRYCLKECYQACRNLKKITLKDEQIHNTLKKCMPELHINTERLLSKGIEFIQADSRIAKTEFDELRTFNNYLHEFQDINHEDYELYFAALIATLNQMGISMKFAKETV